MLVGIGTVLADDPWLTARRQGGRNPMRIVIDTQLRTPPAAHLLPRRAGPRTIVVCGPDAPARREAALVAQGAEIWRLPTHRNGRIDLRRLGKMLADIGIMSVLVEGGGEIHAYWLAHGLADELVIYIAPKVVGGPAKSWVGGKGLASLTSAHQFIFEGAPVDLEGDLRITAVPAPIPEPRPLEDPD